MAIARALILRAPGTNSDEETALAWQRAGAQTEILHVGRLLERASLLDGYQILTIPGGFSYGDDLGAGVVFAARLNQALGDALLKFRDRGGLILGICNGFQVLVRAGLLPGNAKLGKATLTNNNTGRYESRWSRLAPTPGHSPFLTDADPIDLPVAHGEGKFLTDPATLAQLQDAGQVVLTYVDETGRPTENFPANPNGSVGAVAGLCDPTGRIFGLMPHPERNIDPLHHPRWTRRGAGLEGDGLRIFRNAVESLKS